MQSTPRKIVRGAPADKTVILYLTDKDKQLVDKAHQLGIEAVALPAARKLIAYPDGFWLGGKISQPWSMLLLANHTIAPAVSSFELFLWTKEAANLLRRAPAVSRRMLQQGRRVVPVDDSDLLEYLVYC